MSKVDPESKTTVAMLIDAIGAPASENDAKSEIRVTAINLAVALKVESKTLVPALVKALKNDRRHIPMTIDALGSLGAEAKEALPALEGLEDDVDQGVRDAVVGAIAKISEK
jgi:HEAT repeat protein